MLTRELAIAEYRHGQIFPDRLIRGRHANYHDLAQRMLAIYRDGAKLMRSQLHRSVHELFDSELDCPTRRIDAFCKLLDEKATYDQDKRGNASELRRQVFRFAADRQPLVDRPDRLFESSQREVKRQIAEQLGMTWPTIERSLFADVIQFHRLRSFEGYESAEALLARYNVAQTQAVLYDAISMTVQATDDFKLILRYAKLAGLMHTITRKSDGQYLFRFDGPATVLRQTRRYGTAFAKFLPALLSCRQWKLQATIQHRRSQWQNLFRLSPADRLNSNVNPAALFDSHVEANFAEKWGPQPRAGWKLIREGEVLYKQQKVFVPDFVFRHQDGHQVLVEVIGFWTPEYLQAKRETLRVFADQRIALIVADSIDWDELMKQTNTDFPILRYKTAIKVKEVLSLLESPASEADSS